MFAETLSMLHSVGATPYHLTGMPSNTPIVAPTFSANQETAQYALRAVPGGLSLVGVFVKIAAFVLFALDHEVFIKANDWTDILLIGKQIAEHGLCPLGFAPWRWDTLSKKKISDTFQAHAGEILLIDSANDRRFFLVNGDVAIRDDYESIWK